MSENCFFFFFFTRNNEREVSGLFLAVKYCTVWKRSFISYQKTCLEINWQEELASGSPRTWRWLLKISRQILIQRTLQAVLFCLIFQTSPCNLCSITYWITLTRLFVYDLVCHLVRSHNFCTGPVIALSKVHFVAACLNKFRLVRITYASLGYLHPCTFNPAT